MPISPDDIIAIVVKETGLAPEMLRPEVTLGELDIASLDLVSIAFELEDQLGVELPVEDLTPDMTLGALVERVRALAPE